jgi:short-subunit dehydrogenase
MQKALVTGASMGLGAALAKRLAARGFEVWLAARRLEVLEAQVAEIRKAGGRAHALHLDISRADEAHERCARLDVEASGIDLVVANAALAGAPTALPLSRSSWPEVRDVVHTNLTGTLATLMAFVPGMLSRGRGHLVGISSLAADQPNPACAAYCSSKSGLTAFLESADIELRPRGVAVTAIHPGFMRTPAAESLQTDLPLLVEMDDAVDAIDRAILQRARLLRFPKALSALQSLTNALPRAARAALLRRVTQAKRPS